MTIPPLIKINFAALLLLFFAIFITVKMFMVDPTKNAPKQIGNKIIKKAFLFLIRSFFVLVLLFCIIFINVPILQDTFFCIEPARLTGKVAYANHGGLFFPLRFWFSQDFRIGEVTLHVFFYPEFIFEGKTYKVTYLPHSKAVLTIEEIAPLQSQTVKKEESSESFRNKFGAIPQGDTLANKNN